MLKGEISEKVADEKSPTRFYIPPFSKNKKNKSNLNKTQEIKQTKILDQEDNSKEKEEKLKELEEKKKEEKSKELEEEKLKKKKLEELRESEELKELQKIKNTIFAKSESNLVVPNATKISDKLNIQPETDCAQSQSELPVSIDSLSNDTTFNGIPLRVNTVSLDVLEEEKKHETRKKFTKLPHLKLNGSVRRNSTGAYECIPNISSNKSSPAVSKKIISEKPTITITDSNNSFKKSSGSNIIYPNHKKNNKISHTSHYDSDTDSNAISFFSDKKKNKKKKAGPSYAQDLRLKKLGEKAMCYRWLHKEEYEYYEKMDKFYLFLLAILGGITAVLTGIELMLAVFGKDFITRIITVILTGIELFVMFIITIISGYYQLSNFPQKIESHRYSSNKFNEIHLAVQNEIARDKTERQNVTDFVEHITNIYMDKVETGERIRKKTQDKFVVETEGKNLFTPLSGSDLEEILISENVKSDDDTSETASQSEKKMDNYEYQMLKYLQNF